MTSTETAESDIFVVEKLVDMAERDGLKYYRIRWKNYSEEDDTWEPEFNIFDADLIRQFEERRKTEGNVPVVSQVAPTTRKKRTTSTSRKRTTRQTDSRKRKRRSSHKGYCDSDGFIDDSDEMDNKQKKQRAQRTSSTAAKTKRTKKSSSPEIRSPSPLPPPAVPVISITPTRRKRKNMTVTSTPPTIEQTEQVLIENIEEQQQQPLAKQNNNNIDSEFDFDFHVSSEEDEVPPIRVSTRSSKSKKNIEQGKPSKDNMPSSSKVQNQTISEERMSPTPDLEGTVSSYDTGFGGDELVTDTETSINQGSSSVAVGELNDQETSGRTFSIADVAAAAATKKLARVAIAAKNNNNNENDNSQAAVNGTRRNSVSSRVHIDPVRIGKVARLQRITKPARKIMEDPKQFGFRGRDVRETTVINDPTECTRYLKRGMGYQNIEVTEADTIIREIKIPKIKKTPQHQSDQAAISGSATTSTSSSFFEDTNSSSSFFEDSNSTLTTSNCGSFFEDDSSTQSNNFFTSDEDPEASSSLKSSLKSALKTGKETKGENRVRFSDDNDFGADDNGDWGSWGSDNTESESTTAQFDNNSTTESNSVPTITTVTDNSWGGNEQNQTENQESQDNHYSSWKRNNNNWRGGGRWSHDGRENRNHNHDQHGDSRRYSNRYSTEQDEHEVWSGTNEEHFTSSDTGNINSSSSSGDNEWGNASSNFFTDDTAADTVAMFSLDEDSSKPTSKLQDNTSFFEPESNNNWSSTDTTTTTTNSSETIEPSSHQNSQATETNDGWGGSDCSSFFDESITSDANLLLAQTTEIESNSHDKPTDNVTEKSGALTEKANISFQDLIASRWKDSREDSLPKESSSGFRNMLHNKMRDALHNSRSSSSSSYHRSDDYRERRRSSRDEHSRERSNSDNGYHKRRRDSYEDRDDNYRNHKSSRRNSNDHRYNRDDYNDSYHSRSRRRSHDDSYHDSHYRDSSHRSPRNSPSKTDLEIERLRKEHEESQRLVRELKEQMKLFANVLQQTGADPNLLKSIHLETENKSQLLSETLTSTEESTTKTSDQEVSTRSTTDEDFVTVETPTYSSDQDQGVVTSSQHSITTASSKTAMMPAITFPSTQILSISYSSEMSTIENPLSGKEVQIEITTSSDGGKEDKVTEQSIISSTDAQEGTPVLVKQSEFNSSNITTKQEEECCQSTWSDDNRETFIDEQLFDTCTTLMVPSSNPNPSDSPTQTTSSPQPLIAESPTRESIVVSSSSIVIPVRDPIPDQVQSIFTSEEVSQLTGNTSFEIDK